MNARILAVLVAVLTLLGGCVSLPESGSVSTEPGAEPAGRRAGFFDYTPSDPRPGSSPTEIVEDFLLAMQASPQSTAVARKYLTDEGRASWAPERSTLAYGSKRVTGAGSRFEVSLEGTVRLDDHGTWRGPANGTGDVAYRLELVRERGQWRISNPPDALVIPRTHFDSRYQQYFVYYFDPTGRVLVPEPTYLPDGDQSATLLVRRLLQGPHPGLEQVLRTYIPGGREDVLTVPVSEQGVAEVELDEQLLGLGGEDRQMALAQLAWTLRQVTGVEAMQVTVNGSPIDIPGAGSPQSVAAWAEFDPSIHWASQELFGLRDGAVVALSTDDHAVVGTFGGQEYALRDFAVDLAAEQVAAVTEDGTTAVLAPRAAAGAQPPGPEETEVVVTGTDLLTPSWDVFGDLWVVDRSGRGGTVTVVSDDTPRQVSAPGVDGGDVTAFVVSRDGSRVVTVLRGRSRDRLVVSRVVRGPAGTVRRLTPAVELPLVQEEGREIRDLAWRTPGSLAVLTGPTPRSSQVLLALVDGSTAVADMDVTAEVLRARAVWLAAAPSLGTPLYAGAPQGRLYELRVDGQWDDTGLQEPVLAPTYAG